MAINVSGPTPAVTNLPAPAVAVSTHARAPYADAVTAYARADWLRLGIPGHRADRLGAPDVADVMGDAVLRLDLPPLVDGVDKGPAPTPLDQSLALAADAWGAGRTWFLTNGATQGNVAACLALRQLGAEVVVQRSVHSSVVDGLALSGLTAHFVQPGLDAELGVAHGVTPDALGAALRDNPGAVAALVVSPSYFGAVSDIAALAATAHVAGVPLVVDEAWGSHLGFHPHLPARALSQGADLVLSSTHKLGGSLTQSAMLHLGVGPFAHRLESAVDRAVRTLQSTSESALLLYSLDVARRRLVLDGERVIGEALAAAERVRDAIRERGRFRLVDARFAGSPDVYALDPLRLVIDTRSGGITGHQARALLSEQHRIHVEMATDAVIVGVLGPGGPLDVDRLVSALHALPRFVTRSRHPLELPAPGLAAMSVRDAYFSPSELVRSEVAPGRISAESLAAYPPGIPNVHPGEVLTHELVDFLRRTAALPSGHVRGASSGSLDRLRVVALPD